MSYIMKRVTFASSDYEKASLGTCVVEEGLRYADLKTRGEALFLDGCDNMRHANSGEGIKDRIRIIDAIILKGLRV